MKKNNRRVFLALVVLIVLILFHPINNYYNADDKEKHQINNISIIKLLKQTNKNNEHPRLMMGKSDIERIKTYINNDKFVNQQYNNLKNKAEKIINEPPVRYDLTDGVRLLSISRKALDRLLTLGLLYNITGEEIYAKRGWIELETICDLNPDRISFSFYDWHPQHFLDTAEMTTAAAIGYDWLYNYLNENQRNEVREAIYTKGVKEGLDAYVKKDSWTKSDNNWNAVCYSGIAIGALAIGGDNERYEKDAGAFLEIAINKISGFLSQYTLNGGWFEGANYWDYATTYCAYFISSLDSSLKTDYEITKGKDFEKAGDFLIYMTGPKAVFNYADSLQWKIKTPVMVWLASKFNNSEYLWYYKSIVSTSDTSPMSIIWYNDKINESKVKQEDMYFPGIEVAVMHTNILNNDDTFLAFKAGKNGLSHSDLDLGTFVYDTLGERWFEDLGSEDYNVKGYWNMGDDGLRWTYYRKRAEGHNTLVINGDKGKPDQNVKADTKIQSFISGKKKSVATLHLTDAYMPKVSSFTRTFTLLKSEKKVYIEDIIRSANKLSIEWNAHTTADVKISLDKRSATLYKNGKKIFVNLKSPNKAFFYIQKINSKDKLFKPDIDNQFICNNLIINVNTSDNAMILVEISQ
ncbi:heparinase II/III domain-containing protein [Clostridium fungisolvens]|uniref:Heparinase II/III-like C-terminal domain-containing protein n=1 Tax=Clostridium fungisolvens TaxID=1604897 RepID=A0A6V8SAD7_9CLOT|nr:heparinase II/III family protein [Clostridium fungisolvens]GFP74209.1 hypothetical protein bsdtw1_00254 [Clostridium fungisolvens]